MDNGQPVKTPQDFSDAPDFLVAGPMGTSERIGEADESVDSLSTPIERNLKGMGGNIISLSEYKEKKENGLHNAEGEPGLGNVVNMEMPPGIKGTELEAKAGDVAEQAITFNPDVLNVKDGLKPDGVKEVNHVIDEFNKDGNAAEFYKKVRGDEGMADTSRNESFKGNAA